MKDTLALQPILGNFFAGLVISLEKPFRLNDWIRVGEVEGRVVAITWRATHLRTRDNDNLVLPNAKLADECILNYYYPQPTHMERIRVPADHRHPPYRVKRALLEGPGAAGQLSGEQRKSPCDASAIRRNADFVAFWIASDLGEHHRSETRGSWVHTRGDRTGQGRGPGANPVVLTAGKATIRDETGACSSRTLLH